jgi:hypothetical protein
LSFKNYKYKDYLQVFKDTASYTVPIRRVGSNETEQLLVDRAEIPITDSIIVTSGTPLYLVTGAESKNEGEAKLPYLPEKKIAFTFSKATGKNIKLTSPASSTYPGNGGAFGLVNGLSGKDFNAREWQGWNGRNMEAVIDLGKRQVISTVRVGVWSQEPSWIYLPKAIEVYTSADAMKWKKVATETNVVNPWPNDRKITVSLPRKTKTQFVKLVAINHGIIAAGRAGEGKPSWLFVDEIEID